MDTELTEIVEEHKRTMKQILKENVANIALGVATLALSGWVAYDNHKRNNRKEEAWYDHLDDRLALSEAALGLPLEDRIIDIATEKEDTE